MAIASRYFVFVVATPPFAGLVAPERRAVEPRIHAPDPIESAPVRRVGVEHDAILERERAHAGSLFSEGHGVGADLLGCGNQPGARLERPEIGALEVVLDCAGLPFLVAVREVVVVVEVTAKRGCPGEAHAPPPLVLLSIRERWS